MSIAANATSMRLLTRNRPRRSVGPSAQKSEPEHRRRARVYRDGYVEDSPWSYEVDIVDAEGNVVEESVEVGSVDSWEHAMEDVAYLLRT